MYETLSVDSVNMVLKTPTGLRLRTYLRGGPKADTLRAVSSRNKSGVHKIPRLKESDRYNTGIARYGS